MNASEIAGKPITKECLCCDVSIDPCILPKPFGRMLTVAEGTPKVQRGSAPYMGYLPKIVLWQEFNLLGSDSVRVINGDMIAAAGQAAWLADYRQCV